MFRTLLIPLDGSALAERAIPCARKIAASSGARLVLLHVSPQTARPRPAANGDHLDRIAALAAELRAGGLDVEVTSRPQYTEEIGAVIAASAADLSADLIVLSTHGRGGLNRLIYGSVADQVMRRASGPVLLIPASSSDWPATGQGEVLVPLDGSELAESALQPASELARALGAGLFLLRVVEFPVMIYAEGLAYATYQPEVELDEARAYLEQVAGRLDGQGLPVHWAVEEGYPVTVITNRARERNVSLIAMATHGRGGLVRVVLGSVATGTLQRAGTPLLLARPAAAVSAPAAAAAPLAAPEPAPGEPAVLVELSADERVMLRHALGELLYSPQQDWRLAPAARQLLERLREPPEPPSAPPGTPPRNVIVL